jgi:hypothetical protein
VVLQVGDWASGQQLLTEKEQLVKKFYTQLRNWDPCEYDNEPSGSIKNGEFVD